MSWNWKSIVGLVLHILVGGLMLYAGSMKLLGAFPREELAKFGLAEQIQLIGVGEVVSALLLLIPRTSSLGVLLTSSFWGGAICTHMSHADWYYLQSALLVLTWVGAYLRYPAMFRSFAGSRAQVQMVVAEPEAIKA